MIEAIASGSLVGLSLGLIGGGGSILAVPLLVYVVGVPAPHIAIGTSALAVAVNAAAGLVGHARARTVKWPCALVFAASGLVGAAIGSTLGKAIDGEKLLALFGVIMVVVGLSMLRKRRSLDDPDVHLDANSARRLLPRLVITALGVGILSGFFGIGGGFLIVPGLIAATAMPILNAIGSSLVAVTTFGLTTASNYALSGLVDWQLAAEFIAGGIIGGIAGTWLANRLGADKNKLRFVFSAIVIVVGLYVVARGITNIL
ncbi:sulfite exporter TauE/SafE family protein [Breoghania sp.]|uniref:sulfite exporter TauE/SafE family protein n=1 Tax=Breoghania sp. TaxID=2065378 RepID=UPI002AA6414D|nr:sulfite exporter TauE/SafE family protein [Breoghania sp.]